MKRLRDGLRACLAALCILGLSACGGDNDDVPEGSFAQPEFGAQAEDTFVATLEAASSGQPATSTGVGAGTVTLDARTGRVVAVVTTENATLTSLNIREGTSGENGPVVLALAETPPGSGTWTSSAVLTSDQLTALRAGDLHFEAATQALPENGLRGQIVPHLATGFAPAPFNPQTTGSFGLDAQTLLTLAASLRGSFVVPPADSSAQGAAALIVNPGSRLAEVALATSDTVPTSVVVAQGAPGTDGPEVLTLNETGVGNAVWLGRKVLSAEEFDALLSGNLYLLVRSAAFPGGELRGQLLPQQQLGEFPPFTVIGLNDPSVPDSGTTPGAGTLDGTGGTGSGTGTTGFGASGIGTPGFDTSGTGTSGFGASGFGTSGTGTSGFGTSGTGTSGFGTSGIGTSGIGTSGIGTSGIGTSDTGISGFGTSGIGTDQIGPLSPNTAPSGLATGTPSTSGFTDPLGSSVPDSSLGTSSSGSFGGF